MTKEKKYVPLVAFIITAVLVFLVESDKEVLERIGIAIPWGLIVDLVVTLVIRGADDEFRQTASVSDKVVLLVQIIILPVVWFLGLSSKRGTSWEEAVGSLVFALMAVACITYVVKYVVKLFEK